MPRPDPGEPRLVQYDRLDYPKQISTFEDNDLSVPDLTGGTFNQNEDLLVNIDVSDKLVFSTAGNYSVPTVKEWYPLLSQSARENFVMTTSPPISRAAFDNERTVAIGNVELRGRPIIAAGGGGAIDGLEDRALEKVRFLRDYGCALLLRKGNPKNRQIKRFGLAAFARPRISLTISNPKEGGSYNRYLNTAFGILEAEFGENDAENLFSRIFADCKWVAGDAPMHRGAFDAIASGEADGGLLFYHLALYHFRLFPDVFEFVPLGELNDCDDLSKGQIPVDGNTQGAQFYARLDTPVSAQQAAWRDEVAELLLNNTDVHQIFRDAGLIPEVDAV